MITRYEKKKRELINEQIKSIKSFTENDLISYNLIIDKSGDCSVGMISHSLAVIDWLSYLFYGNASKPDAKVGERMEILLKAYSHSSTIRVNNIILNKDLIYSVIRCGVLHQFYGKQTEIKRFRNSDFLICDNSSSAVINPDGLYKMVLHLLEICFQWVGQKSDLEIEIIYDRLEKREQADQKVLDNALSKVQLEDCNLQSQPIPETTRPPQKPFTPIPKIP